MATPLTPAHRSWRIKVFAATWLSYVGFYFCRKPFSSAKAAIGDETGWSASTLANIYAAYLIAYSVGQFLASAMGPKIGPRKNLLLGMAISVVVTVIMGIGLDAPMLAGLAVVNGLAQATGWSGNVGTMANWFHKHERGKVMGVWSTNFTIGAITAGLVMARVLGDGGPAAQPWAWCFYIGAGVLTLVWIQFYFLQRDRPESVGLDPIDDPVTAADEAQEPEPEPPAPAIAMHAHAHRSALVRAWFRWRANSQARSKIYLSRDAKINLALVAGFYFFSKLVRYAIWSWAAYFLEEKYKLSGKAANTYAIAFDICGVPGVFITGWISDRFFQSRRATIAFLMMLGMTAATALLILFGGTSVTAFVVLLGVVGFFLYGPDALLSGAGAMDIGSRRAATFAAAVISGFGSLGPIVQEVIVPRVYDEKTSGMGPVFAILFISAACAALFCAALVFRNRRGGRGI
jgi:MFS transporter, OPA family, glycerol-3-phosphate transporter